MTEATTTLTRAGIDRGAIRLGERSCRRLCRLTVSCTDCHDAALMRAAELIV